MDRLAILLSMLMLTGVSGVRSQTIRSAAEGSKAVLFNFDGFNANEYQGGIGGKYFLSDAMTLRAMLMFGIDNSTIKTAIEQTDNSVSFGIGAGLEYHFPLTSNVSPYIGGALSYTTRAETVNPESAKTINDAFELCALGGIEYFFSQTLSLCAEYQFGFTTTSSSPPGGPDQNQFTLGFQTIGLMLAAYF